MRRQRTEVVVELRKVITFVFFKIYFPPISNANNFKVHYVMVWSFICKSVWHSMYAKFLIYLWWNSVWAYMKCYFYRTKEMSIFWRGEMFPTRTSVRTLMLTEISDRYVLSLSLKSPVIRKSSKHLFRFCGGFLFLKVGCCPSSGIDSLGGRLSWLFVQGVFARAVHHSDEMLQRFRTCWHLVHVMLPHWLSVLYISSVWH